MTEGAVALKKIHTYRFLHHSALGAIYLRLPCEPGRDDYALALAEAEAHGLAPADEMESPEVLDGDYLLIPLYPIEELEYGALDRRAAA
jgi:hypothetical protein